MHASGVADENIVLMTEEDFTAPCDQGGRIVAADITDSLGGEPATNSTLAQPFRLKALSAFHPALDAPDTAAPITGCSAHYFELSGSTLAAGWYGQGLRLIDASNARDLRQVGFYYVTGTDPATNPSSVSWDTAWHGDLVYLFDMARGIEILRLKGGSAAAATHADSAVTGGEGRSPGGSTGGAASRRTRSSVPCSQCRKLARQTARPTDPVSLSRQERLTGSATCLG